MDTAVESVDIRCVDLNLVTAVFVVVKRRGVCRLAVVAEQTPGLDGVVMEADVVDRWRRGKVVVVVVDGQW